MVKIRLSRHGTKKRPFYKIIVTDSRNPRDGRFIEKIGFFDPISTDSTRNLYLNIQRVNYWHSCGAKISKRVSTLIKHLKK